MPIAYSKDLRTRVISAWKAKEGSQRQRRRTLSGKFELCATGDPSLPSNRTGGVETPWGDCSAEDCRHSVSSVVEISEPTTRCPTRGVV